MDQVVRFRAGFLRPAPESEPGIGPRALAHHRPRPAQSPSCRNRVRRISPRLKPSQPAKTQGSAELAAAAGQFARAVLRVVLEVLDGRRPVAQLSPLAETAVMACVRTLVTSGTVPGREIGVATLTRVDVIMSGFAIAEVCAGYNRGTRHFALAARIQRGRSGWRLTAFRVC